MARLTLKIALTDGPRTRPILDGRVKPDGIDLKIEVLNPPEMFLRQLHGAEFDASEMSLSSLLITIAQGDTRFVGLPVFTSRRFFHTLAVVRADAGIQTPADLKGKRVGVPEYQMTAALWSRAALQHVYGVAPQDMEWHMERLPEASHGGATGFQPPAGVKLHYIPKETSIAQMLLDGELDAAVPFFGNGPGVLDRSVKLDGESRVRPLFPSTDAEGRHYFDVTGFYPINHGMVVKREVYEQHPWVVLNLFNAFNRAKALVDAHAHTLAMPYFETGLLAPTRWPIPDIYAYGVRANRPLLEAIAGFSHEQGLTPRRLALEEVFARQTLDV